MPDIEQKENDVNACRRPDPGGWSGKANNQPRRRLIASLDGLGQQLLDQLVGMSPLAQRPDFDRLDELGIQVHHEFLPPVRPFKSV